MLKLLFTSVAFVFLTGYLTSCESPKTVSANTDSMDRMEAADLVPRTDNPSSPRAGGLRVSEGVPPLAVKKF